jgi:hypothetical protein
MMARLGNLSFQRYSEYSNVIELSDGDFISITDKDMEFIIENWKISKEMGADEDRQVKDREAMRRWCEGEKTPTKAVQS